VVLLDQLHQAGIDITLERVSVLLNDVG